jgi:hypothetical protein
VYEIHVSVAIGAPLQRVFAAIADHERFLRGPQISCRLLVEGRPDRNGAGALREVRSQGSVIVEEITAFQPPSRFEYLIREIVNARQKPVPLRHELGRVDFARDGDFTRVDWRSRFEITVPILGWFFERFVGRRLSGGFRQLLEQAKTELESAPAGANGGTQTMEDFQALTNRLRDFQVNVILVGRPGPTGRLTADLDVVYEQTRANRERLVAALADLFPLPRGAGRGQPFHWNAETIDRAVNLTLMTNLGTISLLGEIAGGGRYEELLPISLQLTNGRESWQCVSLARLIAIKRASGRPEDLEAIAKLEATLQEQRRAWT